MENIGDKLPELFYDLIGLFIPGFFFYFCLSLMYNNSTVTKLIQVSFINEIVVVLLLLYLAGHIIYSLSNYFIARIFSFLFGVQQRILLGERQTKLQKFLNGILIVSKIEENNDYFKKNIERKIIEYGGDKSFELDKKNRVIAFEFCRNYIRENTPRTANIVRKEQAYGEMARGIVFVSLVCLIWMFILNQYTNIENYTYKMLFYTFSLLCFSYRYNQARYISPLFIYSTFCSLSFSNNKSEKGKNENED